MKLIARFESDDGTIHETAEACLAYESRPAEARLEGLTAAQIADALARRDVKLADAIEEVGARCREARLAAGGSKRKRREDGPLLAAVTYPTVEEARAARAANEASERAAS